MAVRAALGAGRGRLLGQVLTEGVVLGLAGGVLGVVLAALGVRGFQALDPGGIPRVSEIAVDARVLAFAVALSALTGVLFGLVPAWTSARADAAAALRESGRRATVGRSHAKLRNGLLVAELGLALVLLSGAGVLFNGFVRLRSVDPGFDPERLLTVGLDVETAVPTDQRMAFVDGLLERIGRGAGVTAAGASWRLPFDDGRCCWRVPITHATRSADTIAAHVHPVTAGYFEALGARLVEGRDIEAAERNSAQVPFRPALALPGESQNALPTGPLPVVLGRPMAERLFPGGGAVGRLLRFGHMDVQLRVVGVVDPIMHWGLDAGPGENVYVPFEAIAAWPLGLLDIAVRHDGGSAPAVAAARAAVRELAPDLPIDRVTTMEERIAGSIATPRFYTSLLSTFALLAFILAAAGVYGSMLYVVGLRKREMGIRLALGARSGHVVGLVLRRGLGLVLAGTVLGLVAARLATRALRSLVFEVSVTDPVTLGAAAAALAATGLLACWLPARRAARVDPVSMLRSE
jgi:putative ABC transport system permease protein